MVVGSLQFVAVAVAALAVAVGGFVGGVRLVPDAWRTVRAQVRSARTEPTELSSVTPGGYVEAVGHVDETATDTIPAPFSGDPCVAYGYRVEQSDAVDWQVAEGHGGTEFVMDSPTGGSIVVDPGDTSPDAEWTLVTETGGDERLEETVRAAVESHPHVDAAARPEFLAEGASGSRRYYERRISPDEQLHVYGNCTDGGVHRGRIDAGDSGNFRLSRDPVGSIGGDLFRAVPRLLVGAVATVLGVLGSVVALDLLVGVPGVGLVLTTLQPPTATGLGVASLTAGLTPGVSVGALVGLGALAGGGYLLYLGGDDALTAARIYRNQPINPGEVLALNGVVELEGTAVAETEPMEAVFSGDPCLLCGYRVREQRTETYRDGDGDRERRTVWETVGSGTVRGPVAVESNGEAVTVDPTGADLTLGEYETVLSRGGSTKLPQATRLRLSWGDRFGIDGPGRLSSQATDRRRRHQERRLDPGESVHLYGGTAERDDDGHAEVVAGGEEYLVAVGSELRTVLRRGGRASLLVLGGAVLIAAGLLLVGSGLLAAL